MEGLVRVPVREQEPKVRATNFEEVCYGYNEEEAVAEASRCLNCKNAQCMKSGFYQYSGIYRTGQGAQF